jgi:hypothetical protein
MAVLICFRWWTLSAGVALAGLAIWRTVSAHGNHGIGEGVLAVVLWAGTLWGSLDVLLSQGSAQTLVDT